MALNNNHIIYSAEDIHRYFSGKMNTAEMHAMEKASLNDILLSEAMEGYHQISIDSNAGYTAIQMQLNELKHKISGKTISIKKRINNWWKVAAAILLLISGAFAFYFISKPINKNELSIVQKNNPVKTTEIAIIPVPDSVKNNIARVSIDSFRHNDKLIAESSLSQKLGKIVRNYRIKDSTVSTLDFTVVEKDIASNTKKEFKNDRRTDIFKTTINENTKNGNQTLKKNNSTNDKPFFSGKVTDENNNPIPYANITINNRQQAKTDVHGFFNLSSSDSLIRLDISAANYYPQTITINTNNTTAIKLILQKTTLHKSMSDTLHQSIVQVLKNNGVEPKDGWEQFRLYLVHQLSNSEYDDGRKVVGETIVQFEINRINQPTNFYFEKSIDEDVNNAIENLILTQTEWRFLPNAGIPGRVRLRIVF